jgi:acid phosphatase (class A)
MLRIFLLFFFLFSSNALAKAYFSENTISPVLLTKPLSRDSVEYKNEVKTIIELQRDKSNFDEIKKAKKEQVLKIDAITLAISPKLSREKFTNLYKMLDNIFDTVKPVTVNSKEYWNTKRPYLSEKEIKNLVNSVHNNSYPSGHTTMAYVIAKVLGLVLTKEADAFEKAAEKIAWHRILVGVHYPHDIDGGKELSFLIIGSLMQNKDFLHDFTLAKKELEEKY